MSINKNEYIKWKKTFYKSGLHNTEWQLLKILFITEVPLFNLAVSGILSAIIALLFDLEKLVEFMSIGTLLAYTIVSASVIILRYKTEQSEYKLKDGDEASISTASTASDNIDSSVGGRLKPEFWWLAHIINGCGQSEAISGAVLLFTTCSAVLCIHVHFLGDNISRGEWWSILFLIFLIVCSLGCLFVIGAHKQNPSTNTFRVPWVPVIPGLSILCNVGLMVHLNVLTWIRFAVWMTLGLLVYFLYGIKHSKENDTTNTYLMLISSAEASKGFWGATNTRDDLPIPKDKCDADTSGRKTTHERHIEEDKTPLTDDCEHD